MKHASLLPLLMVILVGSPQVHAQAESKAAPQQVPVLLTREYKTPPDFLVSIVADKDKQNPFERKTAQETLAAWGVPFPEGASALFNPANNLLIVRNTEENLEVVSSLVEEETKKAPRNIVISATVIEGPGKLIREANAAATQKMSAAKDLASLLAQANQPDSKVSVVGDAWLEARSGTRAVTESAREHLYARQMSLDAKSRSSLEMEMRQIGLRLELEAYLGTDNRVITLTTVLNLFPALPHTRAVSMSDPLSGNPVEFPVSDVRNVNFTTGLELLSGGTRILGIAKPVGKAGADSDDVLWIAFITAHVVPVEILKSANSPAPPAPPKQPPPDKNNKPVKHLTASLPGCGVGAFDFNPTRPLTTFTTLHTVQAPAPFLRALAAKAATTSDHAAIWQEIEAAAARGEVSFIDSHVLEAQSGVKAEISATREIVYPASFGTNEKGQPDLTFEMRPMGSRLTLEPTISHDAHTISIDLDYELQTAPPNRRREVYRDPGSKQNFEIPILDFHVAHLQTGFTLSHGGTRLLTLWKPAGHGDTDILWATFLHADVLRQIAPPKRTPAAESGANPQPDENEWIIQVFSVPPDFATGEKNATQVLEEVGVVFPKGAKAYLNPDANKLIVRNQRRHMDMVEAYVGPCCGISFPRSMVFTTHIIQAPGAMIRRVMTEVSGRCDHRPQLDQLLASAEVKHLGTSRIETHSGLRATSTEAIEHIAMGTLNMDDQGHLKIEQEVRKVGFCMSLEPVVLTDGSAASVTLTPEFHTAEPQEHRELVIDTQGRRLEFPLTDYHNAQIRTVIMIPDGTARLLGVWKPTGKPEFETADVLQAAFITCDMPP
jgi:hypothetical protein